MLNFVYYDLKRMRVIQVTEEEKTNEQYSQETINKQLRNFKPHEQLSTCRDFPLLHPGLQYYIFDNK